MNANFIEIASDPVLRAKSCPLAELTGTSTPGAPRTFIRAFANSGYALAFVAAPSFS
jgi:hypothetical protein